MFGSLYGCALLHVLYNLGVLAVRIYKNQPWLRDRVIIWAPRRPIELLLAPNAVPATAYRRIFRNMESIRPEPTRHRGSSDPRRAALFISHYEHEKIRRMITSGQLQTTLSSRFHLI